MNAELRTLSNETMAAVILNGDLSRLTPTQKVEYIVSLCNRVGLDAATQPFKLMKLQGKEIAYADRSCAAQLNQLHGLSHQITHTEKDSDSIMMIDRCTGKDGRFTEEIGAVPLTGLKGEALSNAIMKCRTKAMRRATLTHVGLGVLDETEVESVKGAEKVALPEISETPAWTPQEWNDAEKTEAFIQLGDLADALMGWGCDEAEIQKVIDKPRLLIGDEAVSFDTWSNRLNGLYQRSEKKYKPAA